MCVYMNKCSGKISSSQIAEQIKAVWKHKAEW